jgi:drug/metabolite transporter (DMT)-like permease
MDRFSHSHQTDMLSQDMPLPPQMPETAKSRRARLGRLAGLAPLLAACLWGGMYVVSRASFDAIPPITLGLLRVIIGGLTLWLALTLAARRLVGRGQRAASAAALAALGDSWRFLLLGGTLAATIITQFWGTALASAHDGALLTTITPVFVVPIAWLVLRERPGWRVLTGSALALAGVVIVVASQGGASGSSLPGDALLLISALCWALFTVLGAPIVRRRSALVASTYATLWSILLLAPFVPFELARRPFGAISFGSVLAVLYLGWGATSLAWFLWYKGVERLDAGVAAVFFFAQPLVGGLLSALFLSETLPPGFWLGGVVLAAGIVLASMQSKKAQSEQRSSSR